MFITAGPITKLFAGGGDRSCSNKHTRTLLEWSGPAVRCRQSVPRALPCAASAAALSRWGCIRRGFAAPRRSQEQSPKTATPTSTPLWACSNRCCLDSTSARPVGVWPSTGVCCAQVRAHAVGGLPAQVQLLTVFPFGCARADARIRVSTSCSHVAPALLPLVHLPPLPALLGSGVHGAAYDLGHLSLLGSTACPRGAFWDRVICKRNPGSRAWTTCSDDAERCSCAPRS